MQDDCRYEANVIRENEFAEMDRDAYIFSEAREGRKGQDRCGILTYILFMPSLYPLPQVLICGLY